MNRVVKKYKYWELGFAIVRPVLTLMFASAFLYQALYTQNVQTDLAVMSTTLTIWWFKDREGNGKGDD